MTIALVKSFHFNVSFILEINLGWIYVKLDIRRKRRSQFFIVSNEQANKRYY